MGTLNILSKKKENVSVTIYTVKKTGLSEKAYHIGASLKDAGKKCFAISLLNDSGVINDILQRLDIETEENES